MGTTVAALPADGNPHRIEQYLADYENAKQRVFPFEDTIEECAARAGTCLEAAQKLDDIRMQLTDKVSLLPEGAVADAAKAYIVQQGKMAHAFVDFGLSKLGKVSWWYSTADYKAAAVEKSHGGAEARKAIFQALSDFDKAQVR